MLAVERELEGIDDDRAGDRARGAVGEAERVEEGAGRRRDQHERVAGPHARHVLQLGEALAHDVEQLVRAGNARVGAQGRRDRRARSR